MIKKIAGKANVDIDLKEKYNQYSLFLPNKKQPLDFNKELSGYNLKNKVVNYY